MKLKLKLQHFFQLFLLTQILNFAFTTQPNTLKGWGMGALVSQAQDMFNCNNKLTTKWIRNTSSNVLHAPKPDT